MGKEIWRQSNEGKQIRETMGNEMVTMSDKEDKREREGKMEEKRKKGRGRLETL